METTRYSLVSYLTGQEFDSIRSLQQELSTITGSTKCLTDWAPHITIGDGPEIASEELSTLESELLAFASNHRPVKATIAGFGNIDNWKGAAEGKITPYVIWLNVQVSPELMALWTSLRDSITSRYLVWLPRTQDYIPHVTLAFADLTKEGYEKGLDFIKAHSFESSFTISHIALVECYGEGNMTSREHRRFELGS